MRIEHDGVEDTKDVAPADKRTEMYKRMIEEKLKTLKAIRVAYSR